MPPKNSASAQPQYAKLDELILGTIRCGKRSPLYDHRVDTEAERIAKATGREGFRVVDGRIQALRKSGKIRHLPKKEIGDGDTHKSPWRIVEAPPQEAATEPEIAEGQRPSA